jgi:hypothetical protein
MLLDAGLLQFGRFGDNGIPFRLSLELLPSYPDILEQIASRAAETLADLSVDRLMCLANTVPFGMALSLKTGLPLVYSREANDQPGYNLVGAYDIGHPTVLLANTTTDVNGKSPLLSQARRTGLEIHTLLTIVDVGFSDSTVPENGITTRTLLHVSSMVDRLIEQDLLPPGQAQTIRAWLNLNHRRPDSTAP